MTQIKVWNIIDIVTNRRVTQVIARTVESAKWHAHLKGYDRLGHIALEAPPAPKAEVLTPCGDC